MRYSIFCENCKCGLTEQTTFYEDLWDNHFCSRGCYIKFQRDVNIAGTLFMGLMGLLFLGLPILLVWAISGG